MKKEEKQDAEKRPPWEWFDVFQKKISK